MTRSGTRVTVDAVVVGSGIVGACCTYELAAAGLAVANVTRGYLTDGTTASGEGNLLVSDKLPGPELALALRSVERWRELDQQLDEDLEFEAKGGVVVATDEGRATALLDLVARQSTEGVDAEVVRGDDLRRLEPHLAPDVDLGVHYPQDHQVQPVLASSALLRAARQRGAELRPATTVTGVVQDRTGRLTGVRTDRGTLSAGWVVNAAGPWSGDIARLAGRGLPVRPRRGHVLVTEPCGPLVHHKVYEADYVDTLVTDTAHAQVAAVVESTRAGTLLIGSSREFVGFDRQVDLDLVRRIARAAVRLFPRLATVGLLRAYVGFRPHAADHLPIIGEDPATPGLVHATGHEGAGIGLAPATAELVRATVTGGPAPVDPAPFRPDRPGLDVAPEPARG